MKITDVYSKYKIMPQLQEHQLRVAAVAKQVCDNLTLPVDKETVIKACLLHDMGNIIKFDLAHFPEYIAGGSLEYWQGVQEEFKQQYGLDEHQASTTIAIELGMNDKVTKIIDAIEFNKVVDNVRGTSIEPKICGLADLRVVPIGVVSLDERLADGRRRYKHRHDKRLSSDIYKTTVKACHELEIHVFSHTKIKPSDITDESVAPIIEQLRTYEL